MKVGFKIHAAKGSGTVCGYVGYLVASTPEYPTPYKEVTCKVCLRKIAKAQRERTAQ